MRSPSKSPLWAASGALMALCFLPTQLVANSQPVSIGRESSRDAESALVESLTIQFAAARAASEARSNRQLTAALRQRDEVDRQRRAEARRRAEAEARLSTESAGRAAAEREANEFEMRFLERDREYRDNLAQFAVILAEIESSQPELAAQINAFRGLMRGFVAEASPERRELLRRYASGDREAFSLLQQLTDLENAARRAAAERIAETALRTARRENAHAQRVLGLLALSALDRGDGSLETTIGIWQRVLQEDDSNRLDHLVLARLWMLAADDLRSVQANRAAEALPVDEDMNSRYRFASVFVSATTGAPGDLWRAGAELLRNSPTEGMLGFDPPPGVPAPDARLVPLMENMAVCEQSLASVQQWTAEREIAELDRGVRELAGTLAVGSPAVAPPDERPVLQCEPAVNALVRTMNDLSFAPGHRESLLAASFDLAEQLAANGGGAEADALRTAAIASCRSETAPSTWSALLQTSCVRAQLFSAMRASSGAPTNSAPAIRAAIQQLDRLTLDDFLVPQQRMLLPLTYALGAIALEQAGDVPAALTALGKARNQMSVFLETTGDLATLQLIGVALNIEEARVGSRQGNDQAAAAAFERSERSVLTFLSRHPNSLGACGQLHVQAGQELAWRTDRSVPGGTITLRRLTPVLDQCDRLATAIRGEQRQLPEGLMLRQELAFRLGSESFDREDMNEAQAAFTYLSEVAADAFTEGASQPLVSSQLVALATLSRIASQGGRPRDALVHENRAVELARRHRSFVHLIPHLARVETLSAEVGDTAAAEAASVERVRTCATLVTRPLPEGDEGVVSVDRLLETIAELHCSGGSGLALRYFEQRVAMVEGQAAGTDPQQQVALADDLFFLGQALQSNFDGQGASAAYRRSLELRESRPELFGTRPGQRDLTPYVMARLASLPGEDALWARLGEWLQAEGRRRDLSVDEQALSRIAGELATGASTR